MPTDIGQKVEVRTYIRFDSLTTCIKDRRFTSFSALLAHNLPTLTSGDRKETVILLEIPYGSQTRKIDIGSEIVTGIPSLHLIVRGHCSHSYLRTKLHQPTPDDARTGIHKDTAYQRIFSCSYLISSWRQRMLALKCIFSLEVLIV